MSYQACAACGGVGNLPDGHGGRNRCPGCQGSGKIFVGSSPAKPTKSSSSSGCLVLPFVIGSLLALLRYL